MARHCRESQRHPASIRLHLTDEEARNDAVTSVFIGTDTCSNTHTSGLLLDQNNYRKLFKINDVSLKTTQLL